MFITSMQTQHPTTAQLVKATLAAIVVAGVILITTVLPAEYGIDPTGIGGRLGLGVLATDHDADTLSPTPAPNPAQSADQTVPVSRSAADRAQIASKAAEVFGANAGQSFDTAAVSLRTMSYRNDTLSVTLAPGKGAEVKAALKAGDGIVFHWKATGDVALDMHGEQPDAKGAWTSYAVERAQREASGTFIAPFDGSHGWYWQNRGTAPVTVDIQVAGYQEKLYRP
ncbi:hypothetical protein [Lysobacter hankyongensis]|uniref:Transmembrane anchor protein n=1 Tax=Lysobacter hankyongensis TaxID=1176535 RepID=A0ABP9BKP2_9GAMM